MDAAERSRRIWMLTIRRFVEVAWTRHGATRYMSVIAVPILVAFIVPGDWWMACAAGAVLGLIVDLRSRAAFARLSEQLEALDDHALRALIGRHIAALSLTTACYLLPYSLLAFAPGHGPVMGLLFCAGSAIVCASLHVMTRTMIFYTVPSILLGLVLNGAALGGGWASLVIGALAGVAGLNAIVIARAGASSFGDLIEARLAAEITVEDLDRRVRERTAQLAIATKRAQAANRAKSQFLANMSHELRTPLNAVIGYSEIIEEDLASGDTRESARDLGKIRNSAAHLLSLINEVLDLSRIEAGKLELRPGVVDIRVLLRGAVDTVAPLASKNSVACALELSPEVGLAFVDEVRLRQCVFNLLSNAVKFTRGGRVTLSARVRDLRGGLLVFTVRDTGRGISQEQMARLFQPFAQVDASATRPHDGAGLGLVITRRLARLMGGDVVATSELGRGSAFTLYLPLRATSATAAAA